MKKRVLIFVCCAIAVIIATVLIVVNIVIPGNKYKKAISLLERGDYAGAVETFKALGDYKDSKDQVTEAQKKLEFQIAQKNLDSYNSAMAMADIGSFSDAHRIFEELGDYNDSTKKSEEMRTARFVEGKELFDAEKYDKAYDVFSDVAGWTYHEEYAEVDELEPAYYAAESLFRLGKFEDAYNAFMKLGDYSDSAKAAKRCLDELAYRDALELYEKENGNLIPKNEEYIGKRAFNIEELENVIKQAISNESINLRLIRTKVFEENYLKINEFHDGNNTKRIYENLDKLDII